MADAPVSKTGEHQARVGSTPSFGITEAIRIGSGSGLENRRPEMVCRFDSCRLRLNRKAMGSGLMAGQRALNPLVEVQSLASQPEKDWDVARVREAPSSSPGIPTQAPVAQEDEQRCSKPFDARSSRAGGAGAVRASRMRG
jgi:hypothetical protein